MLLLCDQFENGRVSHVRLWRTDRVNRRLLPESVVKRALPLAKITSSVCGPVM
jgi:hypothetical protein